MATSDTTAEILAQAKRRFALIVSAESDQRERERDDLRFDAGDQWPDDVKRARGANTVNGVPIPARPMLTIPKLDQPVQLVINQQKNAKLGIEVSPNSLDADTETADVIQGLIRHIEQRSRANLARDWAFERAVKCGRGFYRILKRYADDSGQEFDQELVIDRILNQGEVFLDPFAQQPDWSDMTYGFVGTFMSRQAFQEAFPKSRTAQLSDDEFTALGAEAPQWMSQTEDGESAIRVMEYFVVQKVAQERVAYRNERGQTVTAWADALPEGLPDDAILQRRASERREVTWYKLTANEVLDRQDWDGQYIPIIPVIGKEQNIDGKRRWMGIIGPAKDAQRLFNYAVSTAVEVVALEPKAPFIGAEGQFEGHENAWAQANVRNFPYLEYVPKTIAGQPAPPPQRNSAGANLAPSLALVDQADGYIKSATFTYDPSLGSSAGSRSGKAVLALQQQTDAGNSNYLDNLAAVSMTYEAKVLMDLIPKIYDRPGRIARILNADDTQKQVMLNAPFAIDPRTGRPQELPNAQPGQTVGNRPVKKYDLTQGQYVCTVSVGRAYRNRAEQASDEISQILANAPNLLPMIGDLYFKYKDFPGHQEIADRLKRMLPPEARDQDAPPDPQQLMAALEQIKEESGMVIEQLTQQLNAATDALKTKQIELQADLELERMRLQSKEAIAQLNAQTQLQLGQMRTDLGMTKVDTEAQTAQVVSFAQTQSQERIAQEKRIAALSDTLASGLVEAASQRESDDETD